jgi:hypothetical protein
MNERELLILLKRLGECYERVGEINSELINRVNTNPVDLALREERSANERLIRERQDEILRLVCSK